MIEQSHIPFEQAYIECKPYGFELTLAENGGTPIRVMENLCCNFHITSARGVIRHANLLNAQTLGAITIESLLGKSLYEVETYNDAKEAIQNNELVVKNNQLLICDESLTMQGKLVNCISIKIPLWFQQTVLGVLGFSIYHNRDPLTAILSKITQLGLLNVEPYLRQTECLYYAMRGRTATQIAGILGLSPRTVEQHLEHIKIKLNVNSRSELIDYAWNNFPSIEIPAS